MGKTTGFMDYKREVSNAHQGLGKGDHAGMKQGMLLSRLLDKYEKSKQNQSYMPTM